MKTMLGCSAALCALLCAIPPVFGHCEIPCGIYGDAARFEMISEHIATIEKSMQMIEQLSKESNVNWNQLVRWINNKDEHAVALQDIMSQYFMTQRIKPVEARDAEHHDAYVKKLAVLHQMLFYAMKAKQTTDIEVVRKLTTLADTFKILYRDQDQK